MSLLQRLFHHHPAAASAGDELLHWDESLSVGNGLIDNEHREIIRLLNLLYADWRAGAHHLGLARMLALLDRTLDMHFANEEDVMARHRCPTLAEHQAAHRALLSELAIIHQTFRQGSGGDDIEARLTCFVRKVVVDHVLTWDIDAKDYMRE